MYSFLTPIFLLQVLLIVHAVRTGRPFFWIWILVFAPAVGGLAYVIVELLPEIRHSKTVASMTAYMRHMLDPHRQLREHQEALDVADTLENTINLANSLKNRGHLGEALALYDKALTGMYRTDPHLLEGRADIQYRMKDFAGAKTTLDLLREHNDDFSSQEGHLLYAKSLDALGEIAAAVKVYEKLCASYSGPEPKCRLAMILKNQGRNEESRQLLNAVLATAKRSGAHYHRLHSEWIEIARKELRTLQTA